MYRTAKRQVLKVDILNGILSSVGSRALLARSVRSSPFGDLITSGEPSDYDAKFHAKYRPKVSSSGVVRTETARYLRDLGIQFGQINNKSPLHCISLFSNYELEPTKRIVDFFKDAGLEDNQICKIIMKRPYILLRSKLFIKQRVQELREELDLTKTETLDLIMKQPNLLNEAVKLTDVLEKRYQFKRKFEVSNTDFMCMVERDPRFLFHSWEYSTLSIIDYLGEFGFGDKNMRKILVTAPSVVGTDSTLKLQSQVDLFLNYMGFTKSAFVTAVPDYPHLLVYRQRLLKLKFDIIINTGVFDWQEIARAPLCLGYSVERIYMRLNFLKHLNRLEKGRLRLSSILVVMDDKYLHNIAKSDADEYERFKSEEMANVRKMRKGIQTRIIHSEMDLLLDEEESKKESTEVPQSTGKHF